MSKYKHYWPLLTIIAALLVGAFALQQVFVPASYGDLGHFRADALDEALDFEIKHVGEGVCEECHEEVFALHDKDVHLTVACETCHGPGSEHASSEGEVPPPFVPNKAENCMVCHSRMAARPGSFPQIDVPEHFEMVGVKDMDIDCVVCHSPHEPLFMDRDLRDARLHPMIHTCNDCHINRFDDKMARPEKHPALFDCGYCHTDLVNDFESRTHSEVKCSTCHPFFKESDFAGRIIRDTDSRFCLLCHQEGDFRSDDAAPGISWPGHREDVAMEDADYQKRCIDCHQDRIHNLEEGVHYE
jgi:hypothetical protein